jgi:hypothetical protein
MYPTATPTSSAGATKGATPIPTCYIAPPIERDSGAGSANAKGSRAVLLFCLRGIAAFCWAASRRTLEKMLFAYIQSSVDPTVLRSLIAGLVAVGAQGASALAPADDARVLRGKEGGAGVVAHRAGAGAAGACESPKKVSWSYLRGAYSVAV